jgi:cell division protein FtsL
MSSFLEWATHGVKRGRLELDSRPVVLLFGIVVVLALVAALYLALVSRTAAQGRRIEQLQTEVFRLQRENERLAVEIADVSAIPRLIERANALGFAPAEQVEFLMPSD